MATEKKRFLRKATIHLEESDQSLGSDMNEKDAKVPSLDRINGDQDKKESPKKAKTSMEIMSKIQRPK
jgi:hypothetical protein